MKIITIIIIKEEITTKIAIATILITTKANITGTLNIKETIITIIVITTIKIIITKIPKIRIMKNQPKLKILTNIKTNKITKIRIQSIPTGKTMK